MIVSSSTMNPQNVAACAAPGMLHFSSFRCPITSLSCARRSPATWVRACWSRSGAGCPRERQPLQPPQTPPRHRQRNRRQPQADNPQNHAQPLFLTASRQYSAA